MFKKYMEFKERIDSEQFMKDSWEKYLEKNPDDDAAWIFYIEHMKKVFTLKKEHKIFGKIYNFKKKS